VTTAQRKLILAQRERYRVVAMSAAAIKSWKSTNAVSQLEADVKAAGPM
jgi:hypothetical protein